MTKTIAFLQEKGGAGKTTITLNVGKCVQDRGHKVLIVDTDLQRSARDWHAQNDGNTLDVIGLDGPTVDKDLKRFSRNYDYVFIDGAPRLSQNTSKIIVAADVVLIPVQPSPYDLWACENLVEIIKQRRTVTNGKPKVAFIISRRITGTSMGKKFGSVLKSFKIPVLAYPTYQRIAYPTTASQGRTVIEARKAWPRAAEEIENLSREILEFSE
jgi:chromosome partitioning protein